MKIQRQPLLLEALPIPDVKKAPPSSWVGEKQGRWGDWMYTRKLQPSSSEPAPSSSEPAPSATRRLDHNRIQRSMSQAAERVTEHLKNRNVTVGKRLGCGLSGCVHRGHIRGTVIKIDKGDNEARLANHILSNPKLQKIRALPRYYQVHKTDITDEATGEKVHAIHREDLGDFNSKDRDPWSDLKTHLNHIAHHVRIGRIDHDEAQQRVHQTLNKIHPKIHKDEKHHFEAASDGIRKLTAHGIIPCDLHASNWGFRHNGEFVMRDVGCYGVTSKGHASSQ